jgi:hypothetical protein
MTYPRSLASCPYILLSHNQGSPTSIQTTSPHTLYTATRLGTRGSYSSPERRRRSYLYTSSNRYSFVSFSVIGTLCPILTKTRVARILATRTTISTHDPVTRWTTQLYLIQPSSHETSRRSTKRSTFRVSCSTQARTITTFS